MTRFCLEAITNLRCLALLERLGRDPESPLYDLQEKRKAAPHGAS